MGALSSIVVHRAVTKGLNAYYAEFMERHPFLVLPLIPLLPLCNRRTRRIVLNSTLCTSSLARVNTLHAQALQLPITVARQSLLLAKAVGTELYKVLTFLVSSLRTIFLYVPYSLACKSLRAALGMTKAVGSGLYSTSCFILSSLESLLPVSVLSKCWDVIKALGAQLLSLPRNFLSLLLSATHQTLLGAQTIGSAVIVSLPDLLADLLISLHALLIKHPWNVLVRLPYKVGCMSALSAVVATRALTTGPNNTYGEFLERHSFLVLPLLPILPLCNGQTREIVLSSSLCTSSFAQVNSLHAQATEAVSSTVTTVHETLDQYISDPINRGIERVEAAFESVRAWISPSVLATLDEKIVTAVECALDPAWWWSKIF